MAFSADPAALRALGRLLTGTEASDLAAGLEAGEGLHGSLPLVSSLRRGEVQDALTATGLAHDHLALSAVLRGIQGARTDTGRIEPLWTMPSHVAQTGPLTSRIPSLVARARVR